MARYDRIRSVKAGLVIGGVTAGAAVLMAGVVGVGLFLAAILQPYGKSIPLNGESHLYYTKDVTPAEADKAAKFLKANVTKDSKSEVDLQLAKENGVPQLKAVIKEGKLQEAEVPFLLIGTLMSAEVFDGKAMRVHLCDDQFRTLKVLDIKGKSETDAARE